MTTETLTVQEARPERPERPGYRYYVLAVLILIYMLNFLDRQIIGILAAPLKEEFGMSDSQFGLLGGIAFASVYSTLAIPLAWLADRFSRVWIMTGALAVWSGFTALCGMAGSFGQLFLCRMGVGIGEAGGVAPAYSLIADYFPPHQRARAMAAFAFGIPLGMAAGTLVGGLLAATYGWRTAFIVVGLLGVLVAPLLRLTVRDPKRGGTDAIKTECTISDTLLSALGESAARSGTTVVAGPVGADSGAGRSLQLEFVEAQSAGNAFIGHFKSAAVRGVLFEDGRQVATVLARRTTRGGALAGFKGSCTVLDRAARVIGEDLAAWLAAPTDKARLGDF